MSGGADHTCAIDDIKAIWCWGSNAVGQLGTGGTGAASPTPEMGPSCCFWQKVVAGYEGTCAINLASQLYCWGNNDSGQLGVGSMTTASAATVVQTMMGSLGGWTVIAMFGDHSCGIKSGTLSASARTPTASSATARRPRATRRSPSRRVGAGTT